jgi:PAS domain S-box-containing protein
MKITAESGKDIKKRIKITGMFLALLFISLILFFTYIYTWNTEKQRLDYLKQTVVIAHNSISPIINDFKKGTISQDQALIEIRKQVRHMVYTDAYGNNYIFMSSYDGTMLVQPFQSEMEMSNNWDLKDDRGKYIIRGLVRTAQSESGEGYFTYRYTRPGRSRPEKKISYVMGIPQLECFIGTGQYMTDIQKNQFVFLGSTVILSLVLLILIYTLANNALLYLDRQAKLKKKENKELKRIGKALKKSEKKYRDLFEKSPIGWVLCDWKGHFISVNPSFLTMLGFKESELKSLSITDISPETEKQINDEVRENLKKHQRFGPYEKEFIHKKKHKIPVRMNSMVLKREGRELIWSSVENLSGLKKVQSENQHLEERLKQAYKMEAVGTLAGGIAHDFNNMLFPILGYSEFILDEMEEDHPHHSFMEEIFKGAMRAKDMVQQILTFSRQDNRVYTPFAIQTEIHSAVKLLKSMIPSTIGLKLEIDPDCPPVLGDPTQIHQILMNLVINSYHAMEKRGGIIFIRLKEFTHGDSRVLLEIEDQGEGIKKEIMDKIFDPFFTTKPEGKGTGMGLSVVHGIVKGMKGSIEIESQEGEGTTIRIFIPTHDETVETESDNKKSDELKGGEESLLLIDDEEDILNMYSLYLSRLGYKITAQKNSRKGLEAYLENPDGFDLILTDLTMPEITGRDIIKNVREKNTHLPIVLISGNNESGNLNPLEATRILNKPIRLENLARIIRSLLDQTTGD